MRKRLDSKFFEYITQFISKDWLYLTVAHHNSFLVRIHWTQSILWLLAFGADCGLPFSVSHKRVILPPHDVKQAINNNRTHSSMYFFFIFKYNNITYFVKSQNNPVPWSSNFKWLLFVKMACFVFRMIRRKTSLRKQTWQKIP